MEQGILIFSQQEGLTILCVDAAVQSLGHGTDVLFTRGLFHDKVVTDSDIRRAYVRKLLVQKRYRSVSELTNRYQRPIERRTFFQKALRFAKAVELTCQEKYRIEEMWEYR